MTPFDMICGMDMTCKGSGSYMCRLLTGRCMSAGNLVGVRTVRTVRIMRTG